MIDWVNENGFISLFADVVVRYKKIYDEVPFDINPFSIALWHKLHKEFVIYKKSNRDAVQVMHSLIYLINLNNVLYLKENETLIHNVLFSLNNDKGLDVRTNEILSFINYNQNKKNLCNLEPDKAIYSVLPWEKILIGIYQTQHMKNCFSKIENSRIIEFTKQVVTDFLSYNSHKRYSELLLREL